MITIILLVIIIIIIILYMYLPSCNAERLSCTTNCYCSLPHARKCGCNKYNYNTAVILINMKVPNRHFLQTPLFCCRCCCFVPRLCEVLNSTLWVFQFSLTTPAKCLTKNEVINHDFAFLLLCLFTPNSFISFVYDQALSFVTLAH